MTVTSAVCQARPVRRVRFQHKWGMASVGDQVTYAPQCPSHCVTIACRGRRARAALPARLSCLDGWPEGGGVVEGSELADAALVGIRRDGSGPVGTHGVW